ncbi:MAG TPA: YifB family Mg chelatase-like AAA ATPase [Nitrospirae bacterium]|nr:YifB family Mg chelatase-like AAA ATPase [Nitrospirota bacterium]
MLSKVLSAYVIGVDANLIEVEVDISSIGLPHFSVVGLPDTAVKESKDRIRPALKNIGFSFPLKKITVNLAPADIKKEGSAFDLPIAIGIIASEGLINQNELEGYMFIGELSLDGKLKPVRGVLPIAIEAKKRKLKGLLLPHENVLEAAIVKGLSVIGLKSLPETIEFLKGMKKIEPFKVNTDELMSQNSIYEEDFSDIKGQEHAKRALEVAATGSHNVLMIGPPGSGKTMLAKRFPTILPPMTFEEAIEATKIHSVAGLLTENTAILARRPVRMPHHTISDIALIGGGQIPKPGEVSLAHFGVLFLDELPEFKRNVLEVLRQPIENGYVTVSRAVASVTYPAQFVLLSAMNPCPCGYYSDQRHQCTCSPSIISKYRARISGPLLDRIDLHIDVPAVPFKELSKEYTGESSERIRERVIAAREIQLLRFKSEGIYANGQMKTRHIKKYCKLADDAQNLLNKAMESLGLSARAYSRILKVSRTIADMDKKDKIESHHVAEAIQYRSQDRML